MKLLLKQLPEGWQDIEAGDDPYWDDPSRDMALNPAVTSNPGARGEDAPLAVLV